MTTHQSPPPSSDEERWNQRSEARRAVLNQLKLRVKEMLGMEKVPPPFWAICQVADLSSLEELLAMTESPQQNASARPFLEATILDCDMVVDRWLQNVSVTKSSSATDYSGRSTSASRNCKNRDKHRCILTKSSYPDAAHIYPHCLIKASTHEPRTVTRFWDILNLFWDQRRVNSWRSSIFNTQQDPPKPRDGCFNMLSLDKRAHALWGAGRFALRPIEPYDSKTLRLEFHWQVSSSNGLIDLDLMTEPRSSRGLYGDTDNALHVFTGSYKPNGEPIYRPIASGDVFTITTDDPEQYPLPDWRLLEMQWHLQRVAGMSGAAEVGGNTDSDDDHDPSTPTPCVANIRRTTLIYDWLGLLPDNDEDITHQQSPIQVFHMQPD